MTYERAFSKWTTTLFNSRRLFPDQWIAFVDDHGQGFANLDGYVIGADAIVLWECKLTQQPQAFEQMRLRYVPLLEHLYGLPVVTLQVCRNLVERPLHPANIADEYYKPRVGLPLTQHWMK